MDERGLWNLFFATGLPELYLAIRNEEEERRREPAFPAFEPEEQPPRPI